MSSEPPADSLPKGPPPLRPFGLVLRHDGQFLHEGEPIANKKLREHFDRSVDYLAEDEKFIVRLGYFRGEIDVQEAAFFVRSVDLGTGEIALSDQTSEVLVLEDLEESALDGALLCRVKRALVPGGLQARFSHSAQAEFFQAVEPEGEGWSIEIGGETRRLEIASAEVVD